MKWIFRGVTMCAVAGFSLLPAAAAPITYEFSVEATSGPLSGTIAGGTFTFDGSIAPPGGGDVFGAGLLNLDFTWDGITYDESTVKGGNIAFDAAGGLTFAFFGSHCDAGGCLLDTGIKSWDVFLEPDQIGVFNYTVGDFSPLFYEDNPALLEGPIRPVPEPASLVLLGLSGCALILRRIAG